MGLFQCYRETSTRSAALAAEKERDPFFPAMGTEEKEGEEVDVEWESIDAAWRSLWLVLKQNLESGGGSDDESHSDAAALVFRARGHTSDNNDAGEQMTYTSVFEVKRGRNLKGIEVKPRGKDGGGGSAKARESKILFEAKFHKLLAQTRLSRSIKQYTSSLSGKEKHGGGLAKRRTMNRGGLRATPYREQPALHLPVEALEEALMPFFSIGRSQRRWSSGRSTSSSSSSFRDIKHENIQQHDTNKNLVASVSVLAKLLVDCYIKDRDEGVEIAVALFGSLLGNASSRGSARSAVFDVLYTISAHALLLDRRDRRNGTPETSSSSSSSEELQDWILKIVLELMELLMANNESNEDVWFSAFGCLLHLTVKGDDQVLASHTHLPNAYLAKHLVERGDFFRWPAPVRAMTIKYFLASLLQPRRDGEIEEVDRATLEKVGGMRCLLEIVWTAPSESIEGCLRHIALACLGEHETNNTLSKAQIIYAIVTQLGGMMLTVADEAREVVELNFLSPLQGSRDFLRSQPTAGDNNVIVSILTKVAREAEDMSSALLAEIPSHSAAEDTISSLLSFFSSEDLGTRLCAVAWVKSCVINVTRLPVPKRREVLNFLEALCLKGSRGILLVSKGLKNAQEALSKTSSRKNEAITATRMVISLVLKAHKRSAQSDGGEDILSWIDSAIFMGDSLVSSWKAASESSPSQRDIKMFDALSELTKLKQRIRMLSPVRWDSVSQLRVSILTKVIPSSMDSEVRIMLNDCMYGPPSLPPRITTDPICFSIFTGNRLIAHPAIIG